MQNERGPMATAIIGKIGYLTDEQGRPSSMRLMALISLIVSALFGGAAVFMDSQIALGLSITWLGAAYTGKVLQKKTEKAPCE